MDCPQTPYDIITHDAVCQAVKTEYGPDAQIMSWFLQDFVKADDDFSSFVTSIKVTMNIDGTESRHSYIAKLNPCRQNECWKCLTNSVFVREEYFLHDIAPRLCNILTSYNQSRLRLPVDLYSSCAIGKEILISKDLREDSFQMANRRSGLDYQHSSLVLRELARLHAASYMLEEQNIGEELEDMYPFLREEWGDDRHIYFKIFTQFTQNQLKSTIKLLDSFGGYEKAIQWIESIMYDTEAIIKHKLHDTPNKFKVICHGDLQMNNILFR